MITLAAMSWSFFGVRKRAVTLSDCDLFGSQWCLKLLDVQQGLDMNGQMGD